MWVSPIAKASDVVEEIKHKLQPDGEATRAPRTAHIWNEVDRVCFPRAEFVYRVPMTDL